MTQPAHPAQPTPPVGPDPYPGAAPPAPPPASAAPSLPTTGPEPRRRLHPLSPLLRGGRLVVLAIAAISWRGYQELGTQDWLLAIGGGRGAGR